MNEERIVAAAADGQKKKKKEATDWVEELMSFSLKLLSFRITE